MACPPQTRALTAVVLVAAIAVTACAPTETSSPSASPTTGAVEPETACSPVDLHGPSGESVDLTGTWVTERWTPRAGTYYLQQIGACLWWAGGFPIVDADPTFGPTGQWTTVFRGIVSSDFTIAGDWTDVHRACTTPTVIVCYGGPSRPGTGGTMTLEIEFDSGAIRLVYVGGAGELFNPLGEGDNQSWVRTDHAPDAVPTP